jgi:uncharacterized protein YbaR (Trm112 family)
MEGSPARPGRPCPSCAAAMTRRTFDGKLASSVELELCLDCHAIWFDAYESTRLTPGAIIALFRLIHDERDRAMRPLADRMACPACRKPLQLTHDIERSGPITYYRCADGHGRFTTYIQFLREKSFVRAPTGAELDRLRSLVKQVRCSSCGGPIDLARDAACPYCHAPIAILDPDAVQKALASLEAEERERTARADLILDALDTLFTGTLK